MQQIDNFGTPKSGSTSHIITVKTGEDVATNIKSFTQNCSGLVCILSATGALSNVSLRRVGVPGGAATYEGLFDILSLSGSFLPSEIGGPQGGVSVLLAGRDGRVLGGAVAGVLISASPVQVIVSTITPPATPLNPNLGSATRGNSPPSRGTYSGLSSLLPSHPKSKRSIRHEV
ncbi:AT-hook motif nuclear-localized protein 13 [Capsicum annuum]|uniref:AT-hook motif nuclear-localized protein 2 n=1 Tax=Capsicum annuum TaxID=4072 RepID=UPI001FB0B582|nr:AT-hook motif nuclear-localized protein 2 [Capsicum annuum]KAF3622066.1 AT-hook motif nuclear-localized protein 13 [Capsicum annuum]